MREETAFIRAIREDPEDSVVRLVYADWLEEHGDARGAFLRVQTVLRSLPPDHPHRLAGEQELSRLRMGVDEGWLAVVEPERAHLYQRPLSRPACKCFGDQSGKQKRAEVRFHIEPQDTECDAWKRLLDEVEEAARDGREEFDPGEGMEPDDWFRIVTLPPTISKLKAVRRLMLYGSNLVRIPPEISEMTNLEEFDPYTSYRLHWFPYEITHCKNLRVSRVSTRALFGNYKYRPPFPPLENQPEPLADHFPSGTSPTSKAGNLTRLCSVCRQSFEDFGLHRVWISLRVATDVLPLLVNACSEECIQQLPRPGEQYVQSPHRGGLKVQQPSSRGW